MVMNWNNFDKWKRAVNGGSIKVIQEIEKQAKGFLNQRKTKEEEQKFLQVSNSWFLEDDDFKLDVVRHKFGFEHPEAVWIERGGVELRAAPQVKRFGAAVEVGGQYSETVETPPRPYLLLAIQNIVGNKANSIITKSIEETKFE